MSRPFGSKNKTTYILTEECAARLRAMADKRRKAPGKQITVSKEVADRAERMITSRDERRPFYDKAITDALDALEASRGSQS